MCIRDRNSSIAAHDIAKSVSCENDDLAGNECSECQKIDEHKDADFIYANGKDETIKKGIVEYIQEQFAKSSMEGKAKIYLMENIENSTVEAMNSLLKVLEEPIAGVYAIFTCQNLNRVLPTIQSRCQVIQLLPGSKSVSYTHLDVYKRQLHMFQENHHKIFLVLIIC